MYNVNFEWTTVLDAVRCTEYSDLSLMWKGQINDRICIVPSSGFHKMTL